MKKFLLFNLIFIMLLSSVFNINNYDNVLAKSIDNINTKNYVVIHEDTFELLLENNAHEKRQVASICKLMTTYITLSKLESGDISLDDKVFASTYATSMEGSRAYLDNDYYLVSDLLKSVIVASANDSAVVLAEYIAGSERAFVTIMNETAKQLGMNNTLYANATGLPNINQYSSAFDTAIILSNVSKFKLYQEYSNIWTDTLIHASGRETQLVNTNRLLKYYDYTVCGKTGFTDEAGYCLSSKACKNGINVIVVVLNLPNASLRFTDSINLYDYVYSNYYLDTLLSKDNTIDNDIKITKGKTSSINIATIEDIVVLKSHNDNTDYILKYNLPYSVKAPIKCGDTIGSIDLVKNGIIVKTYDVVSTESIEKASYVDYIKDIVNRFGQNE